MVLPYGSRCAIACDIANYLTMGDSFHKYWTCELFDPGREAVLRPPELTCSPWDDHACLVPDPLGYGQVAGGVNGCLPGAMLLHPQDPRGTDASACSVQCAPGYISNHLNRESTFYTCRSGPKLGRPDLNCLEPKNQFCTLPTKFEPGVEKSPIRAWRTGVLEAGQSCSVRCRADHVSAPARQDFVFTCTHGILHVPKGMCIPIDAMSSPPVLSKQTLKLQLVAGDFGFAEREILIAFLASRLDVAPKDVELLLTFGLDFIDVYGEVVGATIESIVRTMYDLAADNDRLWPLFPLTVTSAAYDGPVYVSNPTKCNLPSFSGLNFEPTPDASGCHAPTLPLFSMCTVQCKAGYVSIGGEATFGCFQTLVLPSIICQLPEVLAKAAKLPKGNQGRVSCDDHGLCHFEALTSVCGQYGVFGAGDDIDCY